MLGAELGLGDDHAGILVLDPELVVGTPLRDALGIHTDVLYDLEINPNRPDAMSVAGVARDLAARLGVPFTQLTPTAAPADLHLDQRASVEILAPELCGRFHARVLEVPAALSRGSRRRGWPTACGRWACDRSTPWSTCPTT